MAQLYYTPFTVQTGQVPSAQSDFTVLLLVTDARFKTVANGGHVDNGFDLRPYSDSGLTTQLNYDFVFSDYDGTTGTLQMWVKVPSLSDGYTIYLGYGDSSLVTDGSFGAWNADFQAVYHLEDTTADATGNGNLLTNAGTTPAAGQFGNARDFDNASETYVETPFTDLSYAAGTISWWQNPDGNATDGVNTCMWGQMSAGPTVPMFAAEKFTDDNFYIGFNGASTDYRVVTAANFGNYSTGVWAKYDFTWVSGGLSKLYVDGSFVADNGGGTVPQNVGTEFDIGRRAISAQTWDGQIDEFRIVSAAHSADWITTEWNNEDAPGTFYSIGSEQSAGPVLTLMGAIMV